MHYHLILKIVILAMISDNISANDKHQRIKRSEEKFKVLLNLYKMNPLKRSNIFKTFSNAVLLPNRNEHPSIMTFDSNESTRVKEKNAVLEMQVIEEIIHVTHAPQTAKMGKAKYQLPISQPEEFVKRMTLSDLTKLKVKNFKELEYASDDIRAQLPVTKLLPVHGESIGQNIPNFSNANIRNEKNVEGDNNNIELPVSVTDHASKKVVDDMNQVNELNSSFSDAGVVVMR